MKTYIFILFFLLNTYNLQSSCSLSSDCRNFYKCTDEQCKHKDFFPISLLQSIEIGFMMILSAIATASGLGGGAIYSTLLMTIENFDANKAFPISNFMILLSSISVYLLGAKQNENIPEHKFVDYDLVLIFCPMMMLGTKIGVILNAITPQIFLTLFLILTLLDSSRKVYTKYNKEVKNEEERNKKRNENRENDEVLKVDSSRRLSEISRFNSKEAIYIIEQLKNINLLKVDLLEENQPVRWNKIRLITELLFILLINQLIEGTSKLKSVFNLEKCGYYWNISFIIFGIICFLITYYFTKQINSEAQLRELFSFVLVKNTRKKTEFEVSNCSLGQKINIILYSFIAGIISGMLGIGGGIIITPLFFELGINPKVATSTSNFLLIFSSSTSTLQYLLSNQLTFDYGFVLGILCMLSSVVGFKYINSYIETTGKGSILLLSLLIVMSISLILLPIASISKIVFQINHNESIFNFNSYCSLK